METTQRVAIIAETPKLLDKTREYIEKAEALTPEGRQILFATLLGGLVGRAFGKGDYTSLQLLDNGFKEAKKWK